MSKNEYRKARALIRANGRYALTRWIDTKAAAIMRKLDWQAEDLLALRQQWNASGTCSKTQAFYLTQRI